jgi:hypothetical protein
LGFGGASLVDGATCAGHGAGLEFGMNFRLHRSEN